MKASIFIPSLEVSYFSLISTNNLLASAFFPAVKYNCAALNKYLGVVKSFSEASAAFL